MDKLFYVIVILMLVYILYRDFFTENFTQNKENFENITLGSADDQNAIHNLAQIANDLLKGGVTVPGNMTVKGGSIATTGDLQVQGNFNLLPRGIIVAWTGASAPGGWALCDGNNGTPNLRDRFIVGSGGSYGINSTGGNAVINLNPSQIPPHRHHTAVNPPGWGWGENYLGNGNTGFSGGGGARFGTGGEPFLTGDGNAGQSGLTGSGIDVRPPFYALAYIMKL